MVLAARSITVSAVLELLELAQLACEPAAVPLRIGKLVVVVVVLKLLEVTQLVSEPARYLFGLRNRLRWLWYEIIGDDATSV